MKFCGICTSDRGPFVERPLGRGDALVSICMGCDHAHPRTGRYGFAGGVADTSIGDGNRRMRRAAGGS